MLAESQPTLNRPNPNSLAEVLTGSSQLCARLSPRFPILIPQQPPQDLPARALGDGIDKLNFLEPLVPSLVLLDVTADFSLHDGRSVFDCPATGSYYICFWSFA